MQRRFNGAPVLTLELPPRPTLTSAHRSGPASVPVRSAAPTAERAKVAPPPPPRVRTAPTPLALAKATSEFFATGGLAFGQPLSPISPDGTDNESLGPHGSGFEADVSELGSPGGWSLPEFPAYAGTPPETPTWPAPPPPYQDDSTIHPSDSDIATSPLGSEVSVRSMVWKPAGETPAPAWARFPRPTEGPPPPPRRAPQLASKAARTGALNLTPPVASRPVTVQALKGERAGELATLRIRTAERRLERAAIEAKLTQTLKR